MATQSPDKIALHARKLAEQKAAELFEGEVWVDTEAEAQARQIEPASDDEAEDQQDSAEAAGPAWDPILLRWVSEHEFVFLKPYGEIEVGVDEAGRVVKFEDPSRLEPQQPIDLPPLDEEELVQIAATTGLLGPDASVESLSVEAGNFVALICGQDSQDALDAGLPTRTRFVINPAAGHVAAFHVLEQEAS